MTRGRLNRIEDVRRHIFAGNSTLTIVGKSSRFTFRFKRPDPKPGEDPTRRPVWVSLLNGADNESNYLFMGTIWPNSDPLIMRRSPKSRVHTHAGSSIALDWVLRRLDQPELVEKVEIWHEGKCGRCGRKLTVPESIESGFGPECIHYV